MYSWDLSVLYKGLDDDKYLSDLDKINKLINDTNNLANNISDFEIVDILKLRNETIDLARRLLSFLSLNESVDTINEDYKNHMQRLQMKLSTISKANATIDEYLAKIDNLDELAKNNEYIRDHKFYLQELIDDSKYNLSANEESLISKLNLSGLNNFENQYEYLASSHKLNYNDDLISITEVRNLAYSSDADVRKSAYEAELLGYEAIEDSIAFSLNSIKGYVNTMVDLRGYDSPIDMTLSRSRMQKETLDAMFLAIDESLPKFREYLKHKAKLLGHKNGLPFYDLFAPVVKTDATYSVEAAQSMIRNSFKTFSDDLYNMVDIAFNDNWIDYLPKANKRGGAFCSNLPMIKQSRILSNFSGDLSSVVTLAHELGHAYHGLKIQDHHMLNTGYVMPIAETASNFCELILSEAALKSASKNEKIELLENMISDATQVIVDIYSRYLFEQSVFDNQKTGFLSANKLKELMVDAQLKTYGDGLDKDYLHPYMWIPKGHYYRGGLNFYNFPYAYGGLFAKGLYAKYLEEGESFVAKYDEMLFNTTILSCEDIGKMVDVDVSSKDFWKKSLKMLEDMIDEFIQLSK